MPLSYLCSAPWGQGRAAASQAVEGGGSQTRPWQPYRTRAVHCRGTSIKRQHLASTPELKSGRPPTALT